MAELKFYRGIKAKYSEEEHKDGIYFATDKHEIILNGESYGLELDQDVSEVGTNPVAGSAIYSAIQRAITNAISSTPIGTDIRLNVAGNAAKVELYDKRTDGSEEKFLSETAWFTLSNSDADMSGINISWLTSGSVYTKKVEKAEEGICNVRFKYDYLNTQGLSTGKGGNYLMTISKLGSSDVNLQGDCNAGEITSVNVYNYLGEGVAATVSILVSTKPIIPGIITESNDFLTLDGTSAEKNDSYLYVDTSKKKYYNYSIENDSFVITSLNRKEDQEASVKAYLINLTIQDEAFKINKATKAGDTLDITYTIDGSTNVNKTARCYLDGTQVLVQTNLSGSGAGGTFSIPTAGLSHGAHSVQIRAEYQIDELTVIYSNLIYYNVAITNEGNNTPIIACRINYFDGNLVSGNPEIEIEQYDSYGIQYAVYSPNSAKSTVEFYSENELVNSTSQEFTVDEFRYRYNVAGEKECKIVCGRASFTYRVKVSTSSLSINIPTGSLGLYLDAYGKSNVSSTRDTWTYKNVTSTFSNVSFGADGWVNNTLRLLNGGRVDINYKPFEALSSTNTFTFTIKFKVTNVLNDNEVIISCVDNDGTGITITTQEAKFTTRGGSSVSTKFAAGEEYTIGFVSYPFSTASSTEDIKLNSGMIYLYINGIMSASIQRSETDSIYQTDPVGIILKADTCTLDIYSIRSYTSQLTDDQMFSCYIVDLGDSEKLNAAYKANDVLDFNGNISISSIHGKLPYIIITGHQGTGNTIGTPTFVWAAINNNKKTKFNVDSILYIDGKNPEYNFHVVLNPENGAYPQIQLQGTSSLAYPRKNYKLIFKSKDANDKSIYPNLYLGCDTAGDGGELQKKPKYAMSELAVPVHTFCVKADYAESSSSHNTGMTNMVHNIVAKAGDQTPPQKYVSEDYKYSVRTTVEGHPCLIFYRETVNHTPVFGGKFNFNNDKSTEDVFGFLDIPGYHDNPDWRPRMEELAKKSILMPDGTYYEGKTNPTECWEFCNNENRMGVFKECDFDAKIIEEGKEIYQWINMWEARFPDDDNINGLFEDGAKPVYLMRLAKWINSTDSQEATGITLEEPVTYKGIEYKKDTPEYRQAKFYNELPDYFDVKWLCDYYMINDFTAGVDQRVKNMMFAFWWDPNYQGNGDGMLCYPIYYDCDTIFGLKNDGRLRYNWDVNENTLDDPSVPGIYAFAGHDSVLWKNLRETCKSELEASYVRLRANMDNDKMFEFFDEKQSDMFCEKIYNKDSLYKYIDPLTGGVPVGSVDSIVNYNYLSSLQGTRKAHRHWFINNRMDLFDARYNTGGYLGYNVQWKSESKYQGGIDEEGNSYEGTGAQVVKATAIRDYYFGISLDNDVITHSEVKEGMEWSYKRESDTAIGTTYKFFGNSWTNKLDFSGWQGISQLDLNSLPVLEELIIGNDTYPNIKLESLSIASKCPLIKKLSIINCTKLPTLSLSECKYLEVADFRKCSSLASVVFAESGNLQKIYLPDGYQNLYLKSLAALTINNINFDNINTIQSLWIENCAQIDGYSLFKKIFNSEGNNLRFVRCTGIHVDGDGQDLIKIMNKKVGGITIDNLNTTTTCRLVGTYRLTTLLENEIFDQLCTYFPELILAQPKYTTITLYNKEKTPEKISNYDNLTGYEFGNEYSPSGHISKILEQRHSYLVKKVSDSNSNYNGPGTFAACRLSSTDSYYYYNSETMALLNGSQGDFCLYEPHYWYKGVNDHSTGKIYAFFSTLAEVPTVAQGIKVTAAELVQKKNYAVNATDLYNNIDSALVPDTSYITYKYTLPENHEFKRARVMGVASNKYGCIACDKSGRTLKRSLGGISTSNGMFNGSYLWFDIPQNTDTIWFTISSDNTYNTCDYVLYLTPSLDIEDLEPDWVEHKESFIGRILSAPDATGESISAFVKAGEYPTEGISMSITNLCKTVSERGAGYYPFDYEAYREIFMLGYLSYGTTYLQGEVGQGRQANGEYKWDTVNQYFPNPNVNYAKEGEKDTKRTTITTTSNGISTTYQYVSIYSSADGVDNKFPGISTMMGYHQFIANGGTISESDYVDRTNKTLKTRLRKKVKIFSISGGASNASSYKYANFIQGGRYLDILGVGENEVTYNSENTGYCLSEIMESNSASTAGYLICGYQGYSGKTKAAACLRISDSTAVTMSSNTSDFDRVLRVLIIPNSLIICDNYNDYRKYLN